PAAHGQGRRAGTALAVDSAASARIPVPLCGTKSRGADAGPVDAILAARLADGAHRRDAVAARIAARHARYAAAAQTALRPIGVRAAGRGAQAGTGRPVPRLRRRRDLSANESRHRKGLAKERLRGRGPAVAGLLWGAALSRGL